MNSRRSPARLVPLGLALGLVLMLLVTPGVAAGDEPAISGHVTDAVTGEPIQGAEVGLFFVHPPPGPFANATTDGDGYYEFAEVDGPDGALAHFLHVTAFGYEADDYPPEAEQPLYDGTEAVVVDFALQPEAEAPETIVEIAGANRYATSVAASQEVFPEPDGVSRVVIASGDDWPDALSAAALTSWATGDGGPLLLTAQASLPAVVAEEIERLDPDIAYVVGGTAAVSEAVETELATLVDEVERISGDDRYATSIAVAEKVRELAGGTVPGSPPFHFVVTGTGFADAMAATPISARNGYPILLVEPDGVPDFTFHEHAEVMIVGLDAAVTQTTEVQLLEILDGEDPITRIGRPHRYHTTAALTEHFVDEDPDFRWDGVGIASGINFPDAIAAGAAVGHLGSGLLLTHPEELTELTHNALDHYADEINFVRVLGGTSAVGQSVRDAIKVVID